MRNLVEDLAIWIADVNPADLAEEVRRRALGRQSLPEFERVEHAVLERAVWAHRVALVELAGA